MATARDAPRGIIVAVAFFVVSGALEIILGLLELPGPPGFWPVWDVTGRGVLHFLLALGLWNRIAVCRSVAMVYCLAVLVTYAVAIGLAVAHFPLRYPPYVVVQSLFQVPSCALLLPYLRSPHAAGLFTRPLLGR